MENSESKTQRIRTKLNSTKNKECKSALCSTNIGANQFTLRSDSTWEYDMVIIVIMRTVKGN